MTTRPWHTVGGSGVGTQSFVAEFGLWDSQQTAAAISLAAPKRSIGILPRI